jgi:dimethylargininase
MRRPGSELACCELTHLARRPIDLDRALAQHEALRLCLEELGLEVTLLDALPDQPDAVFVEDLALILDQATVLGRPGVESRRSELESLRPVLESWRPAAELLELDPPATLEGGDVLRVDDILWVGQSSRTNHPGLKQLAHAVLAHGLRVKAVEVRDCLHLRTAVTHLAEDLLLANPAWIDRDRLSDYDWIEVHPDEPFGANGVRVGETIVLSASHPRTAERVRARGLTVRTVELDEFEKAEAGVSCLSLRDSGLI